MMTIPGLALFYGGMVRKKNVLATVMQSFAVDLPDHRAVDDHRLQPRLHRSAAPIIGGLDRVVPGAASALDSVHELRQDHSRDRSSCVPDDLRHHHAGADHRRLRRAHEVLGHAVVHGAVVADRLLRRSPTGCGAAASSATGRARLRRRHRGAHQRRRRRPGLRLVLGKRKGYGARTWRRTTWSTGDRRLAAVGRLVRLQRRLGGRPPTAAPAWPWP